MIPFQAWYTGALKILWKVVFWYFCEVKFLRLNIIFKEKTESIKTVSFYEVNLFFDRNIFRNNLLLCLCFLFITV